MSTGEQADLLTKITNELGGTTTIGYSLSSTFPNTTSPYNYWLLRGKKSDTPLKLRGGRGVMRRGEGDEWIWETREREVRQRAVSLSNNTLTDNLTYDILIKGLEGLNEYL